MRIVTCFAAVVVGSALLAANAWGAAITVSHNVGGSVFAGINPHTLTRPFADVKSDSMSLPLNDHESKLELSSNVGDTIIVDQGTGAATVRSFASAEVGRLRASISGEASGANTLAAAGGGGTINLSRVTAGWLDSVLVATDEFPAGFALLIEAKLKVTGQSQANVIGPAGGFRTGRAQTSLNVVPSGFVVTPPFPGGFFALAVDNLGHTEVASFVVPAEIPIAILSINKQFVTRGIALEVAGQAIASSGISSPASVGAFFESDYARTLTWGGITRVTDAQTGEIVTDWTISSESGFDYANPFPVPEPGTALLLATGFGLLAAARRRAR